MRRSQSWPLESTGECPRRRSRCREGEFPLPQSPVIGTFSRFGLYHTFRPSPVRDSCDYTDGVLNYNQDNHRQRTVKW